MAITIDFSKKYAHYGPQIPEKYRKKFIHPENGFVKLFCEEYEKSDSDEEVRKV